MKNLKEMKLMMERLESPRWTDTEYQKRVKQLKEDSTKLTPTQSWEGWDSKLMMTQGGSNSYDWDTKVLNPLAEKIMQKPSVKQLRIEIEAEAPNKNETSFTEALTKLINKLKGGCKEQPNNKTWKCDVVNSSTFNSRGNIVWGD